MNRFYFTFGSDEAFPFQNTYLVVHADDYSQAIRKFRERHPDRPGSPCVNYAFIYSEKEWEKTRHYYDHEPVETIG